MELKQNPPITELDQYFIVVDNLGPNSIAMYECDESGAYCFDGFNFIHIKPKKGTMDI